MIVIIISYVFEEVTHLLTVLTIKPNWCICSRAPFDFKDCRAVRWAAGALFDSFIFPSDHTSVSKCAGWMTSPPINHLRRKVIFLPPTELSEAIRASLCFLSLDQLMYHPIVSPLLSSTNWDCILTCYSCMTHLATKNITCSLSVSLPCFWLSLMKPGFLFTTSRPLTTNIYI